VNKYAFGNDVEPREVNAALKREFKKSRSVMTLEELKELWDYVQHRFEIEEDEYAI
jgi:hypothetical protein